MANADKSTHYVALILDDLKKLGVQCHRAIIATAVRGNACGNTSDCRYFLKDGVDASSIQGQLKCNLRKARCCTISKGFLNPDILRRLYQGSYLLHSYDPRDLKDLKLNAIILQLQVLPLQILRKGSQPHPLSWNSRLYQETFSLKK